MGACNLKIDLRGYWHPGSGRGGGVVMDAMAHRDSTGLPVLPGRHLKGEPPPKSHFSGEAPRSRA
jgi:CRISPR/Cas system CMR subunit Cmr4 (Cas7 group RAMP superfamily)